jgi:hypothetical protein
MANITLKLLINPDKNSLTFSKNFRIFTTTDPTSKITGLTELIEDLIISSPSLDLVNLNRYFRYSRNKLDWSLWYEVDPTDLGGAGNIIFEESADFYFELKYEYDDGTIDEMSSIIEINEIKLRFSTVEPVSNTYAPVLLCSDELCTSIINTTDPSFRPYQVDSAIGMFKELSFYTNKMFGHEVVYFRTVPESDSGDFIFKEWTLFKNVDRKCIKVMVPKNKFPSDNPKFTEFGLDFELPFEIHLDHRYFQSVFGKGSHPRHRDFLYFPLLNRMYEITGSYLHRGFMMDPTYWKVSLQKYNPNIDMLLTDDSRTFLDNVIQSADELFKDEVENDTSDAMMPKQYDTIAQRFDSSRNAIHPDLRIRPLKYNFNYASLIENYYDLSAIVTQTSTFEITNDTVLTGQTINVDNLESLADDSRRKYDVILAYQDSGPYKSWRNNALITTDKNVMGLDSKFIKIRGPLDTIPNHEGTSESGRYVRIEAYSDLSFKKQRNIMHEVVDGKDIVKFKIRESSIVYNAEPIFDKSANCNLSYTSLFNLNIGSDVVQFLNGYDNESVQGLKISGQFIKYDASGLIGDFTVTTQVNGTTKTFTISNFNTGKWYAMVVSISNEFKQCGLYVYSVTEDTTDITNHSAFESVFENISSLPELEFNLPGEKYYIPSSNMWISNIRLFNTMIKEEDHEFILSQQYLKDESKLLIIDNCKPQQSLPYIAKNK